MPRIESFLFYALIALIAGQLLSHFFDIVPFYQLGWVIALFLFPLPLLLFKKTGLTKAILLYEIMILGAYTAAQHQNLSADHFSKTDKEGLWRVKIQEVLRANDFNYRYYGKILSVDDTASSGKVIVTINRKDSTALLKIGQQLVTKMKPQPIKPPRNPGAFDYAAYLKNIGILGQINLNQNSYLILPNTPLSRLDRWLFAKSQAIEKIRESGLSQSAGAHILALIFGERQYIQSELREAYSRAGLVHLLAISGLHIGIISLFLGWLLLPLRHFKGGQSIRKVLLIVLLWGFALLTGLQPAVVRAVTLFSLLHIGHWGRRPLPPLQRVFLSAWFLLLIHPPFLLQIGFQLSYIAVIGIILGLALAKKMYHPRNKWKRWLWDFVVVCVAAQLSVAPLTIYYFNQFPALFLISNLTVLHLFTISLILAILGTPLLLIDAIPSNLLNQYDQLITLIHSIVKNISSYESFLWDNIYLSQEQVLGVYAIITAGIAGWQFKNGYNWNPLFIVTLLVVFILSFDNKSINKNGQLWVLHQARASVIFWYEDQRLHLFTDAPDNNIQQLLQDFQRNHPVKETQQDSLWRWLDFSSSQLLVLDFDTVLSDSIFPKTDIILLKNNPKIHLDRIIKQWQPKYVIADGSNGPWDFELWKASCQKACVAFLTTSKKAVLITP